MLYRLMGADAQERLAQNIPATLAAMSCDDIIERSVGYCAKADAEYGRRIAGAFKEGGRQDKTEAMAPAHPGLK